MSQIGSLACRPVLAQTAGIMPRKSWRTTALVAVVLSSLGGCGKDEGVGVACDPCGQGLPLSSLFEGVPATCGRGLECVAAAVFLPGPGVCVNTTTSTTCPGIVRNTPPTANQCTYTPAEGSYNVRCGLP